MRPSATSALLLCRFLLEAPTLPSAALLVQLIHGAVARVLVLAPAQDLRPVADALVARVVEGDFDDELRAQDHALELALAVPAARLAREALARLVGAEEGGELALLLGGEAGGVADLAQAPGVVVEGEVEGADRALLLAGAPAPDDGVDR